jgi:site-specific DNA recombinase
MAAVTDAVRAGAYVRISDDRLGVAAGVARQEADCRALAERRSWHISEVYIENDTSAFKQQKITLPDGHTGLRVVRKEFRRLLQDLATGSIKAVVGYDLDRVARDPRDLEDLIEAVRLYHVPVTSVTGSLDLSTDHGVTMARIMVAIANKESLDTSRRVRRTQLEMAEQGKVSGGGQRPYGYGYDRKTVVEHEAMVVRQMAQLILDGDSLAEVARKLTDLGVPTVNGGDRWAPRSVHSAVSKARNAGLREYKGEVMGEAVWPPILEREVWEQVRDTLAARGTYHSRALKRWLTGILVCGECGHRLAGATNATGRSSPLYKCKNCWRVSILAYPTEAFIGDAVKATLQRPGTLDRLAAAVSREAADTAKHEAAADEEQLAELGVMWTSRQIPASEYLRLRKPLAERLERNQQVMRAHAPASLRRLLEADDIDKVWDRGLDPGAKREIAQLIYPRGIRVGRATVRYKFDPTRLTPLTG